MKETKKLDSRHRLIVFELGDVVPRRKRTKPNVFVTTTSLRRKDPKIFKELVTSRRKYAKHAIKLREDLSPIGWYQDSRTLASAKDSFCKELAGQGYCINPDPKIPYSIYVVELKREAWVKDNRVPIYVGVTSRNPEDRIAQHRLGYLASTKVEKHFKRRLAKLEPISISYFSTYDAQEEETKWGTYLLSKGYKVFGPQGLPEE